MFYFFNTSDFRNTLYKTGTGIKVRHTSPDKIENVIINYCDDKKKQKLVVDRISKLNNCIQITLDAYLMKIKLINELKKSLLKSIIFNN